MNPVDTFVAIHDDARAAIREANQLVQATGIPQVIGYVHGIGWTCYDPRNGAAPTVQPELLCFAFGAVPLPLSDDGLAVLVSALLAMAEEESK